MPCFTNGTMICTLKGELAVETLAIGDRVVTRDNGLQTVRRISRLDIDYGQLSASKHLQPMLIMAGALGHGLPERDMLVSPNLRVLDQQGTAQGGESSDELASAKDLLDNNKVRACSVLGVRYVHVEFQRHEVVLANGIWAECFHSDDISLGDNGSAQMAELDEIFPNRMRPVGAEVSTTLTKQTPVGEARP